MKKRVVAMMMTMILAVASLTGCGSSEEEKTAAPQESKVESAESETASKPEAEKESDAKEETGEIPVDYFAGTELNIAISKSGGDASESFNEKPIIKMAEEATGIHINWTEIDSSVSKEQTKVMLASGELPDAMLGLVSTDELLANGDLFYDLSKDNLLETYAPDVLKSYEDGGQNVLDLLTWSDGSIRSLAAGLGVAYPNDAYGIMMVKQSWLDQLGLEIPTTADEFYNMLCAFRDNDMNGNGDKTDEIPLSFCENNWCGRFVQFANSWGIAGSSSTTKTFYYMLKDGKVESTVDTDEYRAFLEYYHKLAADNLLDIEGFSQTNDQYNAKLQEGRVGAMICWTPPADSDYVVMKPFQADENIEVVQTGAKNTFFAKLSGFVASADCSNIEALLHWWNWISSTTDNKAMARYGEEGRGWVRTEDGMCLTENPSSGEDVDHRATYAMGNSSCPYLSAVDVIEAEGERKLMVDQVWDLTLDEYIPSKLVDSLKVEERTFIETDLFALIGSYTSSSVVDGVTDESWEGFLKDLKDYQYYEWLDWWQGHVDGEY